MRLGCREMAIGRGMDRKERLLSESKYFSTGQGSGRRAVVRILPILGCGSPMAENRLRYDAEQVRERTDLLSLIGQHIALKKRGGRYTGLCPFHQEKTPSFSVDPQKGFWHCFGCGKGGDAFNFIMQLEHLSFPEAVERLAERAGVRPVETTTYAPQRKEERDLLFEVNAAAAAAFGKALAGRAGAPARRYLEQRGIGPVQFARFGLGYAPAGWDALVTHLAKARYSPELLVKAGLALTRSQGNGQIDRFRNRLMIPIHDRQGRTVAFGGRALTPDDQPKYLNTAETPVFYKSRTLYALHLAADTMASRGRAIVTEGYFDVIACHLAGFTEAVATLGTALGEEHVQVLRRLAERVYLVFDADSAGINAALRSQQLFRDAEMDVRIVRLPAGHDPDTLLRQEGASAFERCLEEALAPVDFELERLRVQFPLEDAESRVRFFRAAAKVLQPLSKLERAEYAARTIDRALGVRGDISGLQQALLAEVTSLDRAAVRRPDARERAASEAPVAARPDVPLEREVLTVLVQNAEFARQMIPNIEADAFTHEKYRAVFCALREQVDRGLPPDVSRLIISDDSVASMIAALVVREPLPSYGTSPDGMVQRLQEEHERRQSQPREFSLDDRAAVEAFMARVRERSSRTAKRILDEGG